MRETKMEAVSFDCLTGIASTQVSENYDSELNVICGIGGEMSSANYTTSGTVVQTTGLSDGNNYQLGAGYWY